jgi:OmpA-OmpF porin, OOP family
MKKRVIVVFACLLLLIIENQAQLRIGITGGPQLSSVPGGDNPGWDTIKYQHTYRLNWRAGVLADIRLGAQSPLYLQSGLFYSGKGQRFSKDFDTSTHTMTNVEGLQYLNYLEVPLKLMVKFNLGEKTKIMAGGGPYLGFLFNGRERKESHLTNGSSQVNENTYLKIPIAPGKYADFDYGWKGVFGFEFNRVIVSGHYSQGLSEFYTPASAGGTFKNRTMAVTVGYYIFNSANRPAKDKKGRDKDKDGVPDEEDNCPDDKGSPATKGCPDSDADGVADLVDKCPDSAGLAKYKGCPVPDKDKDGIVDAEDKCPEIAGEKINEGCPNPDADQDGVRDAEDKCPDVKGSINFNGCPAPDSDNDGVNDDLDKCPKVKGSKSNSGCPVIKKDIVNKVETLSRRIQFNYKSVLLLPASKRVLNEVVKVLKENPELNVLIQGHASNDGNPANHYKLSYARAYSVKIYLESKGISPFRIKAEGLGSSRPVSQGNAEHQLAPNRRVVMKLSNFQK